VVPFHFQVRINNTRLAIKRTQGAGNGRASLRSLLNTPYGSFAALRTEDDMGHVHAVIVFDKLLDGQHIVTHRHFL